MSQLSARLFKPLFERATRDRSERVAAAARPDPAPVLSSDVIGHRSARVVSLLLTLEALRATPDLFGDPKPQ